MKIFLSKKKIFCLNKKGDPSKSSIFIFVFFDLFIKIEEIPKTSSIQPRPVLSQDERIFNFCRKSFRPVLLFYANNFWWIKWIFFSCPKL